MYVCVFNTCNAIDISLKFHDRRERNRGLFCFVVCFDAEHRFVFDVTDRKTDRLIALHFNKATFTAHNCSVHGKPKHVTSCSQFTFMQ